MNELKKHNITIVVGDWSRDGHGMTETFSISSSLDRMKISEAYKKGVTKLGFSISECCQNYEDPYLDDTNVKLLEAAGFDLTSLDAFDPESEETLFSLLPDDFNNIYLFTVKLGDPSFEWEIIDSNRINIGGYGLFYG